MKLKNFEAKLSKNISPEKLEKVDKVEKDKMESLKGTESQLPMRKNEKQEQEQKYIAPLDLKLQFGIDDNGEELAKLNLRLELKKDKIQELAFNSDLDFKTIGNDTIVRFDFLTQEGREKQAIEYFENGLDRYPRNFYDDNFSPLQNWFVRPTHEGKLELFESKRRDGKKGVTLLYRLYTHNMDDMNEIRELLTKVEETSLQPDLQLNMILKGHADTFKKNRIRIRMDYILAHITSNEFKLKEVLTLLKLLGAFGEGEEIEALINNPAFKLLEKAQNVQGKVKMSSLRKMLELYKIGVEGSSYKKEEKKSPQVIKGLFKSDVRFTFIYESRYGIVANLNYQTQAVLIRLLTGLKRYSQLFD